MTRLAMLLKDRKDVLIKGWRLGKKQNRQKYHAIMLLQFEVS